ncbi:DUF4227 family protein [Paenibacillus athensensis]|uniref:DUF4227 domain-containing protein n=1 Tax=Paenibacillus athensensis TaxID=1967502 RepID=A0A4Y8Q1G5_9BACL|nr:DUF4227 family protein [Paenibacillus athensensis]MCD1260726.1 DUF4227 family protein [Paenibacillus athensensis]
MIFSYRKTLARMRFLLFFMVLTFLLYQLMSAVDGWIEPTEKYRSPGGQAAKVFNQHVSLNENGSMGDRLRLFYWYGE